MCSSCEHGVEQACATQKYRRAKLSTSSCRGSQKPILLRCADFL